MFKAVIIDDEPWILDDLKNIINWKEEGFDIVGEAENGSKAELIIKRFKPDIIFCDIRMPEMSGLELLKKVKSKYKNTLTVFISAYSDFSYAQQAIALGAFDYLLKPVEINILKNVLQKARNHIEEIKDINKKVMDYDATKLFFEILDIESNQENIKRKLAECGYSCNNEIFYLGIVKDRDDAEKADMDLLNHSLFAKFPEIKCLSALIGSKRYVYLINSNKMDFKEILALSKKLKKLEEQNNLSIGISKPFAKLEGLREAFRQADMMIDSDFITSNPGVFIYKTRSKSHIDLFLGKIKNSSSIYQLNELVNEMPGFVKSQAANIEELAKIYNTILLRLSNIDESSNKYDLLNEKEIVFSYKNINQLIDSLKELLNNNHKCTQKTYLSSIINEIVKEVDLNYNQRLVFNSFAEKYNVNPCYLSNMFKTVVGVTFTNYLMEQRLRKAVELLEKTPLTLYEIADKVGYDDYFHFSKLFKKYKGVSPKLFRRTNT